MTPTQLRTFAAIARHGSSRGAAGELGVSEAAVSSHVAALRKELGDDLFHRSGSGLAFTPGGLRLAARAVEMLGLQDRTLHEIRAAGEGQRVLRVAVSSLFGEIAAPGLIELFSSRADDLQVEVSEWSPDQFARLITARIVDVAIGPEAKSAGDGIHTKQFLRYQLVAVVGAQHALAGRKLKPAAMAEATWLLGPSAVDATSSVGRMLRHFRVPEARQRIFPNHAAALTEARQGHGVALCPAHSATAELADGRLVRVDVPGAMVDGVWATFALRRDDASPLANEIIRFVSTPRAIQAMLTGSGANIARFKPRVHVTLWS
ncbi:LysR family transcriptional regulator [Ilumatobacter sp.]|uniref:LysR family transcriptional regulator n=1 Tax=Ilumatobacter sp. TaxID=1967498 RepID=UPI003C36F278